MSLSSEAPSELARYTQGPDEGIDLAEAALVVARLEHPNLEILRYLERLDALADAVRLRLDGDANPWSTMEALNHQLFEVEGFRGNERDYYDPRNSYLNEVLDRKLGIPITLSLIYMEVGRRVSLPVQGVGLPGHFLVKVRTEDGDVLLDPFSGGTRLTVDDCQELLDRIYGGLVRLERRMLEPVPRRHILVRLLNNLKTIYLHQGEFDRALVVVNGILVLEPSSLADVRDRGLLYYRHNRFPEALADLRKYLLLAHDAEDRQQIKQTVHAIETIQTMIR